MIAFLAAYFAEILELGAPGLPYPGGSLRSTLQSLAPTIAMWLVAVALLITQQDLGAASLLLITYVFMLYLATGRARLPLALFGALMVAGVIGYFASDRVTQRLSIWLNPWIDPQGDSFQVVQSLIAVASGGLIGQGINQGHPDVVPAVHTDFPFVMVSEELGLIAAIGLIACFCVLALRGWRIALTAPTAYRMLLAGGLAAAIATQVFVIVGGNLGLVPLTGVTLPMVSYGGSSLLVSYLSVGLLIRLSADGAHDASAFPHGIRPPFLHMPASMSAGRRAMAVCAAMFGALSVASGFWAVAGAQPLVTRDDNPRRVLAELAIARGPILARDGTPLAMSRVVTVENNVPRFAREYPVLEAAPVVGYYSQRYGTGGVEAVADEALRGERGPIDELLHRGQIGAAVTTTIDLALQQRLFDALRHSTSITTSKGAAVVLDWRTGDVLALVSVPSFDPNLLERDWDALRDSPGAPLINRATQGLYQPGPLLQWMLALRFDGAGAGAATDSSRFVAQVVELGLSEQAPFELPNEVVPPPATATFSETIGQGELRVTPLRVATTVAALAAGEPITPSLLAADSAPAPDRESRVENRRFDGFAQIGPRDVVGWHVAIHPDRVIVIALEGAEPDPAALRLVAEAVWPGAK
jgi:peptidoglycan glycosyltransferase